MTQRDVFLAYDRCSKSNMKCDEAMSGKFAVDARLHDVPCSGHKQRRYLDRNILAANFAFVWSTSADFLETTLYRLDARCYQNQDF